MTAPVSIASTLGETDRAGELAGRSTTPKYRVGTVVTYRDREGRLQTGEVLMVEARWWNDDPRRTVGCLPPFVDPFVTYTVRHPSYRNGHFHTADDRIVSALLNQAPSHG